MENDKVEIHPRFITEYQV